jgi:hypothetical protein
MSNAKTTTTTDKSAQPKQTAAPKVTQRRNYGYGLGRFFRSQSNYARAVEKDLNHSFELGYN